MQSLFFFLPLLSAQPAQPLLFPSLFRGPNFLHRRPTSLFPAQTAARPASPPLPPLLSLPRGARPSGGFSFLPSERDSNSRSPAQARRRPAVLARTPRSPAPPLFKALHPPEPYRIEPPPSSLRTTLAAAAAIVGLAWSSVTPPFPPLPVDFKPPRSFAPR